MQQLTYKGQVVATSALLAEQLGATSDQLSENFNANKIRYEEGKHFFLLKGTDLKEFREYSGNSGLQISSMVRSLYLWTEQGAFNHVKSLGTNEAWDAFKVLVDTYFKVKAIKEELKEARKQARIERCLAKGKDPKWIKERIDGVDTRKSFTKSLKEHGVEDEGYRNCTNAIYIPIFGGTAAVVREKNGIDKKANIRDNLSRTHVTMINLIEQLATENIEQENAQGNAQCEMVCSKVSQVVATAVSQIKR